MENHHPTHQHRCRYLRGRTFTYRWTGGVGPRARDDLSARVEMMAGDLFDVRDPLSASLWMMRVTIT